MDDPAASVPQPAAVRPFRVEGHDGIQLVGESWRPRGAATADVVVLHGFAEHRARYRTLAGELTAAGYAVHLFDLRGHGESGGDRGHVEHFADYRRDLERVAEAVLPPPGSAAPTVLLAHSLGGLIAVHAVLERPDLFGVLALSSPFLAPETWLPPAARTAAGTAARMLGRLEFSPGIDAAGLSRDPEVVEAYRRDPLILQRASARWLGEVLAAQDEAFARAGELRLPILVLLGSDDLVAKHERSLRFYDRLQGPDRALEVYDGFLHEVLNERGRERVVADLLAWLAARLAAR